MLAVDRPVSADAASGRLCDAAGGGYAIGDRSEVICRRLWQAIPAAYRTCRSYSDYWAAYAQVWPSATHRSVGKHEGQTNHVERWNNTLRQANARYVRKTLAFSKSDYFHELVTRLFIIRYNQHLSFVA